MQYELNIIPAGGAIKHHQRTAGKARIQPAPKVGRWVQGELTSPCLRSSGKTPGHGVFRGAWRLPLNGGQSASRLCMVRCRWRGMSPGPARDQTAIRLDGGKRLNADVTPRARGMQRESAASPLPRWCCTTTHILRSTLSHESADYGKRCDGSLASTSTAIVAVYAAVAFS